MEKQKNKNKGKSIIPWRRLDNSAKIFPISAGKKYSSIFRISAVLYEKIKPEQLKQAVDLTLQMYKSFKVRMRPGFFWYYLEENPKEVIVEEEKDYPCKYIEARYNNDYLFKVTYFENKISIDIFHSLTDGNSGTAFFREIVYNYLDIVHKKELQCENRIPRKLEEFTTEDSYIKNYDKKAKSNASSKRAYLLKGKRLKFDAVGVTHQIINLEQLKTVSKSKNATITQYLTAVLIYSIFMANYSKNRSKKPIKVCIPVNLKKYFQSKTMSNFFSYITLEAEIEKDNLYTFEDILDFVKKDFGKRLTQDEITKTMSANVKLGTNFAIRVIPLILKKPLVRISYLEIRKYTTTTLSNIGRMGIIGKYKDYIDFFTILISPDPAEKIKCSACSFENKMVFTFTSFLNDVSIEKYFYNFLEEQQIEVKIESNGVLDDISTKN